MAPKKDQQNYWVYHACRITFAMTLFFAKAANAPVIKVLAVPPFPLVTEIIILIDDMQLRLLEIYYLPSQS